MSIEQGLVAHLRADSTVAGIVGTRIFPNVMPQNADRPAIVYTLIGSARDVDMSGPAPMVTLRIQVDCWHTSYAGMKTLADAVRSSLNGVGIASPKLLGSESVQLVLLDDDRDLSEFEGDERDYRRSQDWLITYLEV